MAIDVTVQDSSSGIDTTIQGGADTRVVDSIVEKTGSYTANNLEVVLADVSGGGFSVTLPSPTESLHVVVKKTDSSGNSVTIASPGSENIDGQSSISISSQYASRTIVSNGTNYFII